MTRVSFKTDMNATLSNANAAKIIKILERFVTEVGQIMPLPSISISIEDEEVQADA